MTEAEGDKTSLRGARRALSPKAIELGRGFLSALFMGLRTAQIHDSANKAFERAVQNVRVAAEALYAATGGFSVNFVDESAFLNGVRLRFDGTTYDAMVTLRHILEQKELGGIEMRAPPSYEAVRKLILLFSASPAEVIEKDDLLALQIGILGVQRFADKIEDKLKIDRRVFALHCYAKLMLAYREQLASMDEKEAAAFPRLRATRIVQDVVELSGDRLDFLLRLGSNHTGAPADELHAANVAVLSIALGRALQLQRADLVDLGVGALLHDVGRSRAAEPPPQQQLEAAPPLLSLDALMLAADDPEQLDPAEYVGEMESIGEDDVGETTDVTFNPMPFLAQSDGVDLPSFADATKKNTIEAPGHPGHPEETIAGGHAHTFASYARMLAAAGLGKGGLVRTLIASEHHRKNGELHFWNEPRPAALLFSRIVAIADVYDALCSGMGTDHGAPISPLEALSTLMRDVSGRIDPDLCDLLINVLRAFPVGTEVVLDTGERGVVVTHEGSTRWDRPVVHAKTPHARTIDLMIRDEERFVARIRATARFLGAL